MKLIFALVATLIAFSAHASDRKIGEDTAVEEEIYAVRKVCVAGNNDI